MPFLAALIPSLIGAGSSILGSALSGQPKPTTTTTTPTFSPELQGLQSRLLGYSSGLMSDPSAGLSAIKGNAQENINRRYAGAPTAVSAQLAKRGLGSSGAAGGALFGLESSRLGDMSNLESNFADLTSQRQMQGASLGQNLLQLGRGTTTVGTPPNMSAPNGFASAGGQLNNLSTLLMLSNVLKGGGSSSGGGSGYSSGDPNYDGSLGG